MQHLQRLGNHEGSTPCPSKKGATRFFTITYTNVHADLRNFWYTTLQVNTNHTDELFTKLPVTYIPYLVR